MSNSHPLRPYTAVGEIDHVHILSDHVGVLMNGEEYSDVTFIVEKKRFPAHRVILAARCQYFRALLYGGMRESQPEAEIPLQDTTAEAFTMLLKYIYTGRAILRDEKEEVLLDFLSLAHKYGFPELEDSTSEYLCTILNIQNVCMTYDVASLYSLHKLTCMCCMFMDRNAQEVLSSEGFLSLSKAALLSIVLRDSFAAPEKDIFQALVNWCKHNPKENHSEIMQAVRLPLMSLTELLNVVRPSKLLSADAILDAIKVRSESRDMDLNYRGMLIPGENIATMKYGAQVVKGELKSALLDGDTQNYDLDHGFSRHPIDDDCRSGIEIKLGQPSIINHIRILLWDRDSRSYSYYIEVSMDELDWIRVIDHSKYLCRSWQKLYFPARVCRYIRIVGTHNTVNKVFHIVAFECMFTNKTFTLEKGLIDTVRNKSVQVLTDNTTAMFYVNKQGGTASATLCTEAMKLWTWAIQNSVWLRAVHIPGVENLQADQLSRLHRDVHEWSLRDKYLVPIFSMWGFPELDLFATLDNRKAHRYCSRGGLGPGSDGDAFQVEWSGPLCYAFPPFPLLARVLSKIQGEGATVILIAPFWPRQPWFHTLLRLQSQSIRLPLVPDLLSWHGVLHHDIQRLKLTAWLIIHNRGFLKL
ncbi:BTB/POZ domain-containing protein 9 isoform X1 [Eublepharis macularius]|uniref:BTB/POZ domain-containing protein 9 n=1 Tax=Eublepharis macularius TaxID=481883 RepID=A0AA97J9W9_EUBMA|nr:BTB/POZ domain-containing protein 9 isoform X1 [Eublepharis macularius]